MLAMAQAVPRLTRAEGGDMRSYVQAVEGRFAALARAHTLLAEEHWAAADLGTLAEGELAPFLEPRCGEGGAVGPSVALDGPILALTPGAAQAVSMALHELATNALKYGALSSPRGRVALSWSADRACGQLRLRWAEAGGPPILAPPARRGFGSRVIGTAVRDQLGGTARWSWEPAGLICDLAMPLARALADEARRAAVPQAAAAVAAAALAS